MQRAILSDPGGQFMTRGLKWAVETCSLSGHLHREAVDLTTVIANPVLAPGWWFLPVPEQGPSPRPSF